MKYERIKELREDNDLKQRQLAKILNISQSTYSSYEVGNREIPIYLLIALAKFYNTSVDYLLGITNDKRPYTKR